MVGISDVSLPETAFVTSYSSIELDSTQILSTSSRTPVKGVATLVFVGSLEQLYKAPDVLLRALGLATARGCDLRLRIVGDGRYREELQVMALKLGIAERCQFLGQLPGGVAVQNVLDGSDIFVLPSRVEGLPRAMIEAMARGLPCIGSTVGGIPELLEPESLVKPGDPDQLASAIETLVADPERQKRMAMRNLREAAKYVDHQLRKKRIEFYRHVKLCSSEWLGQNHTKPILSGSGRTGASTLH
ncbi:MAG: glycosyltransferase family 4 protein [Acidobacteriaceae bacterium]|nr:glycosyltransferase family 4 protein [Acidobacteriaceae bacterium]